MPETLLEQPATEKPKRKWAPPKRPGKNLDPNAILVATSLLDLGVPIREAAKQSGISVSTAAQLTPTKRKEKLLDHVDPETARAVRAKIQDKFLLLSDGLLDTIDYSKAEKAGLGETVQAAAKLAELAGIKQPDRTEHYHAVMLKFEKDGDISPTVHTEVIDSPKV